MSPGTGKVTTVSITSVTSLDSAGTGVMAVAGPGESILRCGAGHVLDVDNCRLTITCGCRTCDRIKKADQRRRDRVNAAVVTRTQRGARSRAAWP